MITCIPNVLTAEEAAHLNSQLSSLAFADGNSTAGWHAREVKNNLQLTLGMAGHEACEKVVGAALGRNPIFQMAVRPRFAHPILFNRYEVGMHYGRHIDDPVMMVPGVSSGRLRSDVSFTLFLSDPAAYQGGELLIDAGSGVEQTFKLPLGSLIAYSANTLHRVAPVTTGVRLAAIGWIQSEIRDPAQRAILFDLDMARRGVFAREGKSNIFDLLSKSHANLLRLWAEL